MGRGRFAETGIVTFSSLQLIRITFISFDCMTLDSQFQPVPDSSHTNLKVSRLPSKDNIKDLHDG